MSLLNVSPTFYGWKGKKFIWIHLFSFLFVAVLAVFKLQIKIYVKLHTYKKAFKWRKNKNRNFLGLFPYRQGGIYVSLNESRIKWFPYLFNPSTYAGGGGDVYTPPSPSSCVFCPYSKYL